MRPGMAERDAAIRVFRHARRVPAVQSVGARVVGRVRASRLAREIVGRVFDFRAGPGGTVFLSGGTLLGGLGVENVPVVVVSLVGLPADEVPGVVRQIAREQVLSAAFRPVLVVDDALAAARRFGYPVELLVPQEEWPPGPQRWGDYSRERLVSIRRHYRAVGLVSVPDPVAVDLAVALLGGFGADGGW